MVRLLDMGERFKTSKKQLDEYFKNIKEIEILKNFNNIKLEDVKFSYTKDSAQIKIPEFYLEKGDIMIKPFGNHRIQRNLRQRFQPEQP